MMFAMVRTFWKLLAGKRRRFLAASVALIIASCFLYLAPLVPQIVLDGVIATDGQPSRFVSAAVQWLGGKAFIASNLWMPALLILGLTAAACLFTYLRGRWSAQASEAVTQRVRDQAYDRLQRLPCRYFDKASTGDLVQRCTSDVDTLHVFLSTQVVEIGRAIVMLLVPIPLMLAIDPRMTVASVFLIPLIVGFAIVYFGKIRHVFKLTDEAEGRMTATLQENLSGIRVVRAFARQDFECEKFDGRNVEHRNKHYRLYLVLAWYWSISDLMCFLQVGTVVGYGAYLLFIGDIQVGTFYFFITTVNMFIWPVRMMGRILADLGKATVAIGRLNEILEEPIESAPEAPVLLERLDGHVEFENVSFRHNDRSPALDDVSFKIPAGRTLALLGPPGSGKSTIVNLLLRFYGIESGAIRVDGHSIDQLDRSFLRSQMAVVMQDPFLFSKTLRDNLTIGRPGVVEGEMVEMTSLAAVHDNIVEFEEGYDTIVGERGVTLSGGQRQRVALARALLQQPSILILDDALSAVDTETEALILEALRQRHGRHTTIVIAHRLSTLIHADEILVLDKGQIIQRGTHATLSREAGLYQRLWQIQTQAGANLTSEVSRS
jgi:ATP-binding cassette subfamily B protein